MKYRIENEIEGTFAPKKESGTFVTNGHMMKLLRERTGAVTQRRSENVYFMVCLAQWEMK